MPINGTWLQKDWSVFIQGRIDQVIYGSDSVTIREIKTINATLPLPEDELLSRFHSYFLQLATYLVLADINNSFRDMILHGELLFLSLIHI